MKSKRVDGLSIRPGPTVSGICKFESDMSAVGGELIGINFARLTVLNILWILLMILPIILLYALSKRGVRLPTPVRSSLRYIPSLMRAFLQ